MRRKDASSDPATDGSDSSPEGMPPVPSGVTAGFDVATILIDGRGHIFHFDEWAERLTGFTAATVIGRDYRFLFGSHEHAPRFPDEGDPDRIETGVSPLQKADGRTLYALIRSRRIRLPAGEDLLIVQALEIESARRTQSQIGLLDGLFHQAPFCLVVLDEHLRYVMVNAELAEFNGLPAEDHIGRHIGEVIASATFEDYQKLLKTVLKTGEPAIGVMVPGIARSSPGVAKVWSASWYRIEGRSGTGLALCGLIYDVSSSSGEVLSNARTHERHRVLGLIGELSSEELDQKRAAARLVEVLTGEYCDLATIDLLTEHASAPPRTRPRPNRRRLMVLASHSRIEGPDADRLAGTPSEEVDETDPVVEHILATETARLVRDASDLADIDVPPWIFHAASEIGVNSFIGAPLVARGKVIGVLSCMRAGANLPFSEEDLRFVKTIASRTALMLDNARMYHEAKDTALKLQMNLLPAALPEPDEALIAHRYDPGHEGHRVSGDWYDVGIQPGHRVSLVVGDVIGHGIDAATTMGRYRTAVQAFDSVGMEPSALMTRLNALAGTFGDLAIATCLYAVYDPQRHLCTLVSAGHTPLIVCPPEESPYLVEERNGPLLGGFPGATYTATRIDTPPGTRLFLYSDGLVESPAVSVGEGMERLLSVVDDPEASLEDIADAAMSTSPRDSEDDRTLLACELRGLRYPLKGPGPRKGTGPSFSFLARTVDRRPFSASAVL
ncbi:SpoIIE family protein phosphatase [Salininema proteolyticum]|uniref:SpoIIE family protein phosphatase n=1 Tax=Salininema proteolyticum TaxID=1607685 RepID=A0ABV8U2X2_9ACTN